MLKVANSVINASQIATPITLPGDVTLSTGNLVIGTAGKGVDFTATTSGSGTMTSELFADYEEGTWTPTQGAGLTVVGAFSSSGTYTKIGRLVTVLGNVEGATSVAVSSVGVIAPNLPFTIEGTLPLGSVMRNSASTSSGCWGNPSTTNLHAAEAVLADTKIWFSITYFVQVLVMSLTKVTYSMIKGSPANVLDYGADLTGVADSSAAFTAAFLASTTVYAPTGTYKLASGITMPPNSILYGDQSNTIIKPSMTGGAAITVASFCKLEGFYLNGVDSTGTIGIYYGDTASFGNSQTLVHQVQIENFLGAGAVGLKIQKALRVFIDYCYIKSNQLGCWITTNAGGYPTTVHIANTTFSVNETNGLLVDTCYLLALDSCIFESNKQECLNFIPVGEIQRVQVTNTWFEDGWFTGSSKPTRFQVQVGNGNSASEVEVNFKNCFFNNNATTGCKSIDFYGVRGSSISEILCGSGTQNDSIRIRNFSDTSSSNVTILDNAGRYGQNVVEFVSPASAIAPIVGLQTLSNSLLVRVPNLPFAAVATASTDPTTLDCYLEGSFTPVVQGLTTAGTYTFTNFSRYIKIGKLVWFQTNIVLSAIGSAGTGSFIISGLPFEAEGSSDYYSNVPVTYANLDLPAGTIDLCGQIRGTTSYIQFFASVDNGAGSALACSALSATTTIQVSGSYQAVS